MALKPYILNVTERVAHRRIGLTESCNTDDIVKRRNAQFVPRGYRRCAHCDYAQGEIGEQALKASEDLESAMSSMKKDLNE